MNIAALGPLAEWAQGPGFDFKAFQLPTAIIFSITGVSRASTLVQDIDGGYFDRLLATPVNRVALLLGLMVADFTLAICLCIPVMILALHPRGVRSPRGSGGCSCSCSSPASGG